MSSAKEPFFQCIATTLGAALCILSYPSDFTEGEAVPEVELSRTQPSSASASCLLSSASPVHPASALRGSSLRLQWTQGDECLIETAHNSARVSFWFAAAHQPKDPLTTQLLEQYVAFFCRHGASTSMLPLLRCEPLHSGDVAEREGCARRYDISFLLLPEHVERYGRGKIVDFVVSFVRNVEADVAGLKVSLNARRRAAARAFFS